MNTTHVLSMKSGGLRHKITSALVALSLVAGMIGVTATPAHAASVVSGCFTMGGRAPAYPLNVELRVAIGNTWRTINTYKTASNGCVSIPMTLGYSGYYAILYAYDRNYGGTLYGWSGRYATPGSHASGVGWAAIQYSCVGIVTAC